jgi:hypothetical protein
MYLFSLLLFINSITLAAYFICLALHSNRKYPSKPVILLVAFSIAGIVYLVFVRKEKYKLLYEQFKIKENLNGKSGTWMTLSYIIVTLLLLLSTAFLKCK